MDVIRSHAARLPALDDRWTPGAVGHEELLEGLRSGAVAGPEITHPLDNVLRNIRLLHEGDPDKQFGMTGLQTLEPAEILELVGRGAGFKPDPSATTGPVPVDPHRVLEACGTSNARPYMLKVQPKSAPVPVQPTPPASEEPERHGLVLPPSPQRKRSVTSRSALALAKPAE